MTEVASKQVFYRIAKVARKSPHLVAAAPLGVVMHTGSPGEGRSQAPGLRYMLRACFKKIKSRVWGLGVAPHRMCAACIRFWVLSLPPNRREKVSLLPPWMEAWPETTLADNANCGATKTWEMPVPEVGSPLFLQSLGHLCLCEGAKAGPCKERLRSSCPLVAS